MHKFLLFFVIASLLSGVWLMIYGIGNQQDPEAAAPGAIVFGCSLISLVLLSGKNRH